VPFVVMQLAMVGTVIAFPGMALPSLESAPNIHPSQLQIELPQLAPDQSPQIQFQ